MTQDQVIAAAKAARQVWGESAILPFAELERFYAIVRAEALDDASLCAAIHCQYPVETDFDRGYGKGSRDASDRIRALKEKP